MRSTQGVHGQVNSRSGDEMLQRQVQPRAALLVRPSRKYLLVESASGTASVKEEPRKTLPVKKVLSIR